MGRDRAPVDEAVFTRLWMAGVSGEAIAARCGIAVGSVTKIRRRFGLAPRWGRRDPNTPPEKPAPAKTYASVQELVAHGMTQRQALCEFHRRRA
jgi:hypothetical protein